MNEQLQVLIERRNWLRERIKAKQAVGWEVTYDTREMTALMWAIELISKPEAHE